MLIIEIAAGIMLAQFGRALVISAVSHIDAHRLYRDGCTYRKASLKRYWETVKEVY